MCQWGTTKKLCLIIPKEISHTGADRWKVVDIDSCIADIVEALNEGEVWTANSCCGHGKTDGSILLSDGRELIIKKPI